jgi:hypothetical protein
MKDLPKMHNFSYYFCVSLVICKQTLTRKKNIVPRDIEDIVCKPKKTCTINDHFWTMLFHLCVCVWKRERESANGKIVFSLVNSSNFASFWGNFLCHKIEKRIQVTHNLFSQMFAIKHPQRHWIYSLKTQENMHSSQHFLHLLFPNSSLKKVIHMYYSAKPCESVIWKQKVYARMDRQFCGPSKPDV